MKNEFCKILIVENHQVLITKGYESEDDLYKVNIAAEIGGVRVTVSPCFKTKREMNKCYTNYSEYEASKFLAVMYNTMK